MRLLLLLLYLSINNQYISACGLNMRDSVGVRKVFNKSFFKNFAVILDSSEQCNKFVECDLELGMEPPECDSKLIVPSLDIDSQLIIKVEVFLKKEFRSKIRYRDYRLYGGYTSFDRERKYIVVQIVPPKMYRKNPFIPQCFDLIVLGRDKKKYGKIKYITILEQKGRMSIFNEFL